MDAKERIPSLIALLLRARRPLTHRQISEQLNWVYGGEDGGEMNRRLFERDKERLRSWGYDLDVVRPPEEGVDAYLIRRDAFFLSDADLTPSERYALRLAAAASVGGAADAIDKLGGHEPDTDMVRWVDPGLEALGPLLHAVAARSRLTFRYQDSGGRASERNVEPWGLLSQDGYWYLVCYDLDRGERRSLRVDRIDGPPTLLGSGTCTEPFGPVDGAVHPDPKQVGDGPVEVAHVAVHPDLVGRAVEDGAAVPTEETVTSGPVAGWSIMQVPYRNRETLRSWVLGFGARARIVGPDDVVDWFVASLRGGADGSET